jgi:hypothetical protein
MKRIIVFFGNRKIPRAGCGGPRFTCGLVPKLGLFLGLSLEKAVENPFSPLNLEYLSQKLKFWESPVLGLFNNPVGCFTGLAGLADFFYKSAKPAVF